MPDKKPEDPTDMRAWKLSLLLKVNRAINQFLTRSIEKGLINNEKERTMTFVRDIIVGKIRLVTYCRFPMVMEKKFLSKPTFD